MTDTARWSPFPIRKNNKLIIKKGWVDWLLQFTHPFVEFIDFITKKE